MAENSLDKIRKIFGPTWKPSSSISPELQGQGILGAVRVKGTSDVYTIGDQPKYLSAEEYAKTFGSNKQEGIVGEVSPEQFSALGIAPRTKVPAAGTEKKEEDMTASFLDLSGIQKQLKELQTQSESLTKPDEEAMKAAGEATKATTKSLYEIAREDIKSQTDIGMRKIDTLSQQLTTPATISGAKIKEFQDSTKDFYGQINRSIERLTVEEAAALEQADYNTAEQIRTAKLDYINTQRQMIQDNFNIVANAYNMMLSGQQYKQQVEINEQTQASNRLNTVLAAYGGKGFESLPDEVKSAVQQDAETLGLPLDVVTSTLSSPAGVKYQVSKGDKVMFFDANGNLVKSYTVPSAGGGNVDSYVKGYLAGDVGVAGVGSVPSDFKQGFLDTIDQIKNDAIGGLVWNERVSLSDPVNFSRIAQTNPADIKNGIVENVTSQIIKSSPELIGKIMGVDASYIKPNEETIAKVKSVVAKYIDELIPDSYVQYIKARSKDPLFNTTESISQPSDDTSQTVDTSGGGLWGAASKFF